MRHTSSLAVIALALSAAAAHAQTKPYYRFNQSPAGLEGAGGPSMGTNGGPLDALVLTPREATLTEGSATQARVSGGRGATYALDAAYPGVTLAPDGTLTVQAGDVASATETLIGVTGTWSGGTAKAAFRLAVNPAQAFVGDAAVRSGQPFSMGLTTDMVAPGAWTLASSPADVTGFSATGQQAGTGYGTAPAVPGTAPLTRTVVATYAAGAARAVGQGTLTVHPDLVVSAAASRYVLRGGGPALAAPAATGRVGALRWSLLSGGTDVSENLGAVCPGLAFDRASGAVTGAAGQACDLQIAYVAADDGNGMMALRATSAQAPTRLRVVEPGLTLSYPNGGRFGILGATNGVTLPATIVGGCEPLVMSLATATRFGQGLSLSGGEAPYPVGTVYTNGAGSFVGTHPTVKVRVSDACGQSADADVTVDAQHGPASVTTPAALTVTAGSTGATAAPGTSFFGPGLRFELASGTLPDFLTLAPATGVISGTVPAGTAAGTTWTVSVRALDDYARSATTNPFSITAATAGSGDTAYTLPTLELATNFYETSPVSVARLYDGKNTYVGRTQLPNMWCYDGRMCQVIMGWDKVKLWNVMRINATSNPGTDQMVVYYDSGDGTWRRLWTNNTGNPNVQADTGDQGNDRDTDNSYTFNFPDTPIKRVRLDLVSFPGGWGHVDDWRFGYGSAPPVP